MSAAKKRVKARRVAPLKPNELTATAETINVNMPVMNCGFGENGMAIRYQYPAEITADVRWENGRQSTGIPFPVIVRPGQKFRVTFSPL